MSKNEVLRLAAAIAQANGHSHPQEYAETVASAWEAVGHPDAPKEDEHVAE